MISVKDFIKTGTILTILLLISSCSKDESEFCIEHTKDDCFWTQQYDPVCGCNNKTYENSGHALCSGITEFTNGPCKK